MDTIELKKALGRASVLTILGYILSGLLFRIYPEFKFSEIVLGILVGFNLVFITIQFNRAINPSSFFDLDIAFKSKIIIQYVLNILIFIVFILRF